MLQRFAATAGRYLMKAIPAAAAAAKIHHAAAGCRTTVAFRR